MDVSDWLRDRGLPDAAIEELIPLLPDAIPEYSVSWFYTAEYIMDPDRWFHCPGQSRFVFVGQCPDGSAIAIDSQITPGAVFYVSTNAIESDPASGEFTVRVADSPADFAARSQQDDFPMDYYDAI